MPYTAGRNPPMIRQMTTSLLNLDRPAEPPAKPVRQQVQPQPQAPTVVPPTAAPLEAASKVDAAYSPAAAPRTHENDGVDYEIVFGRRQVASTGLVLVVALACFSGVFYLIGKSAGTKLSAPGDSVAAAAPLTTPGTSVPATPAPAVKPPAAPVPLTYPEGFKPQAPVFGEALAGNVYIQVGAIERGLAGIWAEGLRTHGLEAFVATGRNDKEWRVLVGPLPDPSAFRQAKELLDKLGVPTFGRRYISSDTPAAAAAPAAPSPAPAAAAASSTAPAAAPPAP
jgi:hypothetical protein